MQYPVRRRRRRGGDLAAVCVCVYQSGIRHHLRSVWRRMLRKIRVCVAPTRSTRDKPIVKDVILPPPPSIVFCSTSPSSSSRWHISTTVPRSSRRRRIGNYDALTVRTERNTIPKRRYNCRGTPARAAGSPFRVHRKIRLRILFCRCCC